MRDKNGGNFIDGQWRCCIRGGGGELSFVVVAIEDTDGVFNVIPRVQFRIYVNVVIQKSLKDLNVGVLRKKLLVCLRRRKRANAQLNMDRKVVRTEI